MNIAGWDERYRSDGGKEGLAPTKLVVDVTEQLAPGAAIDLACGAGRHALYLAGKGWAVMAVDGSESAIKLVQRYAASRDVRVETRVADLTDRNFSLQPDAFDLVLIAYYLQRDLLTRARAAVRAGGVIIAITHTPEMGEEWSEKFSAPGELRGFFKEWEILWDYEGPSRDPLHRRPVAEVAARRPVY